MFHLKTALFGLSLFIPSVVAGAQQPKVGHLSTEPYILKSFDGQDHPAELGKLWVQEDRTSPSSHVIQLAFVRLKSTAMKPGSPIIFLAGGPGVPGSVLGRVPVYFHLFERLREVADVILLDQRGIGLSSPNLQCPQNASLPPDALETFEKARASLAQLVRSCTEYWRGQGVDVSAYTTNASADDLDDLRRALGAERISLLGHSYGTRLALAAIRRHGERIDRAVLAAVQGPDQDLKLPFAAEFGIRRLSRLAAEDPTVGAQFPDVSASLHGALAQLERQPLTIPSKNPRTDKLETLRAGKFALQIIVATRLKDMRALPLLPALIATMRQGDPSLFAPMAENLFWGLGGASAMQFAMTCSDGASPERRAGAAKQAPSTLLADVENLGLDPEVCQRTGVPAPLQDSFFPLWSAVPTLFLSGSLDPHTSSGDTETVRQGFPNGTHIIVENGGHEVLPGREIQDIVVDFFKGADVGGRRVAFEKPAFLTVEQAKQRQASR